MAGVIGEEDAVGVGKIEEAVYPVVDVGLDGDKAGGEVGVLALPVGKGGFPEIGDEQGFEKGCQHIGFLEIGINYRGVREKVNSGKVKR